MASAIISILLILASTSSLSSTSDAEISRKELRNKPLDQETIIQLPMRSRRIDPSRVVQLSWRPRLFVYRGFISGEECDHLISLVQKRKTELGPGLISRSELLDAKDNIVATIEEMISAWTLLPQENSRIVQIHHYGFEDAGKTYDYFGNSSKEKEPLMATVVIYLSDLGVTQGGGILFPGSELKDSTTASSLLRPIKGNAVLFFHVHPDATPDKSSYHVRIPVLEGDMWYVTKLFHLRAPSSDEKDISQPVLVNNGDECIDEDNSCPKWASLGECEKNPVFMVGSPDYYGTCRKSCKVC